MAILTEYRFGGITANGTRYQSDLIVLGEEVLSPWNRKEGHRLDLSDLAWPIERHAKVIVVGTGAFARLVVPRYVTDTLSARGIEILPLKTARAVEAYNEQCQAGKRVAACLHLTC